MRDRIIRAGYFLGELLSDERLKCYTVTVSPPIVVALLVSYPLSGMLDVWVKYIHHMMY